MNCYTLSRRDFCRMVGVALAGSTLVPRQALALSEPIDADQVDGVLFQQVIHRWYPRCVDDQQGGFHERMARDWSRSPDPTRFVVYQARMSWVPAFLMIEFPDRAGEYQAWAEHGLRHLIERQWDARYGGFFERITPAGALPEAVAPWKNIYGQAFGLYAAATLARATKDPAARRLADDQFDWMEARAHDDACGGYFELLTRAGEPDLLLTEQERQRAAEGKGVPLVGQRNRKSMNAHIHLLEALAAHYQWRPESLVRKRLEEVFLIVRDKIVHPDGHLIMFANRDFAPTDQRSSFGHQLETAYLLHEAAALLRRPKEPATDAAILALVDHALRYGEDREHGGFFNEGPPDEVPHDTAKVWWVQPEAINGLITAARVTSDDARRREYLEALARTWEFFRAKMVDPHYGGCYGQVTASGQAVPGHQDKATPWKTAYHVTRGLAHLLAWSRDESHTS